MDPCSHVKPIPTPKFEETGFCRCPLPLPPGSACLRPRCCRRRRSGGEPARAAAAHGTHSLADEQRARPGPWALCQSILDLATQTTPQAKRRRRSSGPPSLRCRCVRNASILIDPRPGRGRARSVVVASVGDFRAWTLPAARPQPRRAGGGLAVVVVVVVSKDDSSLGKKVASVPIKALRMFR